MKVKVKQITSIKVILEHFLLPLSVFKIFTFQIRLTLIMRVKLITHNICTDATRRQMTDFVSDGNYSNGCIFVADTCQNPIEECDLENVGQGD